jgi:hypothetical protein
MRNLMTLTACWCLATANSVSAAPPEMETIERFVEQNAQSTNGGTEVHIGLRCYSLFRIMYVHLKENGMSDLAAEMDRSSNLYLEFARSYQQPENDAYLLNQTKIMVAAYTERFLVAKARTGNFSDDPVIAQDFTFCRELLTPDP